MDDMVKGVIRDAENGNAQAQYILSIQYKSGSGVPQDLEKSAYWLNKAAEQGHSEAQNSLGMSLLKQDKKRSMHWLEKASEQNHPGATYWLAMELFTEDSARSKELFHKAAKLGSKDAQETLSTSNPVSQAFGGPIKNPGGGGKKKGCYVATCIYGSYDSPEVLKLRRYRDNVLAQSWHGRKLIAIYYAISPRFVDLFGGKKWFHGLIKPCIDAIVARL